jgi:hypothetical protein
MRDLGNHLTSALLGALGLGLVLQLTSFGPVPDERYASLRELADHLSVEYLDDGAGGLAKTFRFTGVNVQLVNALGATNGNPGAPGAVASNTTTNSSGNLIVGYREASGRAITRVGSHNVVVGTQAGYEGFGGLLSGWRPEVSSPLAAVLSGDGNHVTGDLGVAAGGAMGTVVARSSTLVGGFDSRIVGERAYLGGGRHNVARADETAVLGGSANFTEELRTTITGGAGGRTLGRYATVSGGVGNTAQGPYSTVTGGENNTADGPKATVASGMNRSIGAQNQSGNRAHDGVLGTLWEDG